MLSIGYGNGRLSKVVRDDLLKGVAEALQKGRTLALAVV